MASMNPAAAGGVPYSVPPEPSRTSSVLMALAVHAGLLLFLGIGVSWQNDEPTAVEAEVWDMKVQDAAPPAPQPEPVRQPEPVPEPPRPVAEPVAPKAPDIALEKIKEQKKKLADKKLAEEKLREDLKKEKELELAEQKAKAAQALADKKKAEQALADKKKADQRYKEDLARLMGAMGTSGTAEKSTAPRRDTGYAAAIRTKIKNSTNYLGDRDVEGNPRVEFKIQQVPSGEIISIVKTKASGVRAFDDAVERGIRESSPLPKKKDGTVERTLDIGFSMKEFD